MKTLPDGTRVLGTVAAGSKIIAYKGMMIAIHPDHPPKVIDFDGIHELEWHDPEIPVMVANPLKSYSAIHEVDCCELPR